MTSQDTDQPPPVRILIINPNTSESMTKALEPAVESLYYQHQNIQFRYFTCPSTPSASGIASINSPADAEVSATACLPHLLPLLPSYTCFLVACYSQHPLVPRLQAECAALEAREAEAAAAAAVGSSSSRTPARRHVTGIFEASVTASLNVVGAAGAHAGFGIVSTGKVWEAALAGAVEEFMGGTSRRFLECETTGLNASELHEMPAVEVRRRMMDATKRLVDSGRERGVVPRAVCLGCAGMVGLEEAVREALVQEMGAVEGRRVAVVDGVKAGVGELVMLARGGF